MEEIISLDDPRIEIFLTLKSKLLSSDKFIADSPAVIAQLLKDGIQFEIFFGTKETLIGFPQSNIKTYFTDKMMMEKVIGHKLHHGLMAVGVVPKSKKELFHFKKLVAVNGISSPENIGSIIRSARAFGFDGIIVDSGSCHPYTRRCVRVSMGHVAGIEVFETNDLLSTLRELKKHHYRVLCLDTSEKAAPLKNVSTPLVCVLGREVGGISANVSKEFGLYQIPMNEQVSSLNVSCAAAVAMYQLSNLQ